MQPLRPARPLRYRLALGLGVLALLAGVFGTLRARGGVAPAQATTDVKATWQQLVDSEEVILSLDPHMARLSFGALNLSLPDFQSRQVFADHVRWADLAEQTRPAGVLAKPASIGVSTREWPVSADVREVPLSDLGIWKRLFDQVEYFESAAFKVVRGKFLNDRRDEFETDLTFSGNARTKNGTRAAINASVKAIWQGQADSVAKSRERTPAKLTPTGKPESVPVAISDLWRITSWRTTSITTVESDRILFAEALDQALPNVNDLRRARTSLHERLVIQSLETGKAPDQFFERQSFDRHPGVSVVDINHDGFDDFYVMDRVGANLFFLSKGDGTFDEVGARLGLDIDGHTSSAIFADFDNDGDDDLFLGRTLARSMYLENVNGRFVDRSAQFGASLPYLVSSVSASDYDRDGLLDVYFSTYSARQLNRDRQAIAQFLSKEDFAHLVGLLDAPGANRYKDLAGPPNVLLRNRGGGSFNDESRSTGLSIFRNTYQSTWADFDDDGDQDVYLANDFGINNLMRNDGGKFVDVAPQTGTTDLGFGMGASWGDYDNDGKQDLYVSNMYSKAGRRITAQLDFIDPGFGQMARGNSLFRSTGARFDKVSGLEEPAMLVEKVGWAWGGQFADLDNDGFLDVHSLSGFYTSPRSTGLPDL